MIVNKNFKFSYIAQITIKIGKIKKNYKLKIKIIKRF